MKKELNFNEELNTAHKRLEEVEEMRNLIINQLIDMHKLSLKPMIDIELLKNAKLIK